MKNILGTPMRAITVAGLVALCIGSGCRQTGSTPELSYPPPPERPAFTPAEPPPKGEWRARASAVQEEIFPAEMACDGKADTRWSSPAADPQWLEIDLGRAATICGLTILWETAYASEYNVAVSLDGNQWTPVFTNQYGDGQTDDIFFRPVSARLIRITGTKRGTGWGHSIWEVDVKGPGERVIAIAPAMAGSSPENLFDGDQATVWRAANGGPLTIQADLRKVKPLGGIRIDWGETHATGAVLYLSRDGSAWDRVAELREGAGGFDLLMHPRAEARFLRLELTGTLNNQPAEIREITLRGPEETVSSLALYQLAAGKARPGHYPDHLRGRQVYWTITGLPGDSRESLLDEYGNLEPYQGMGSLMPYLFMNGRLLSAFDAERVTQTLEDGALPLPTVQWQLGPLSVSIQAFTWGGLSDAATFVRYLIANVSKEKQAGRFFLAVRPVQVNPAWQYGGLSPIQSLLFQPGENFTLAKVNGVDQYVLYSRPDGFGATAFDQSDVVKFLARGQLPPAQGMDNGGDLISGAVEYNFALEPGAASNWIVAAPLHGSIEIARAFVRHGHSEMTRPDDAFTRHWNEQGWFWREQLGPVRIEMPEQFVADAMRAQIGYILVNRDGVAIQPGSRNYKRTWIRDGSLTGAAMLRMGLFQPIREYLEWYAARVQPDGLVPPILNNDGSVNTGFGSNLEYDSQGQFIYALMEYWRFTKDTEFLKRHFPQIRAALEYLVKLREQTLAPDYMRDEPARERFVGILPKSFSHEGYAPPMHSYWDDFWALKGWKDGAEAARAVGDEAAAQWAEEQYKLLRDSVVASIEKTIAYRQIDFIPGCAEKGDPDPTSTAIAFFPCEEQANLPPTILRQTFERYFKEIRARKIAEEGCTFTPYEIRSITPFVELGEKERAVELLDYMLTFRRPVGWQHWAEVVLGDARKASYIGDMPHTWVGSGYVNALRGMLAEERDGILILLAGAPEKWLAGRGLNISNLPTWYGPLNLKARLNQNTLTVSVAGAPEVKGLELRWPRTGKPARVRVNGADWTDWDALACRLPAGDHEVQAEW